MMNLISNSSRLQQSVLQKRARAGLLLVVAVLCSQGLMVQAAQLGAPEIRSYLGEPLQARIALENVNEENIAAAKTSLAPPMEWARQGAGIYPEDLDLQVAIERDEAGYYVDVQSRQPVSEPVLQLLLDLQMPQQPLVSKPYILFLDPKPSPGDLARRSLAARQSQRLAATSNDSPDTAEQDAAAAVSASDDRTSVAASSPSTGQAINAGSYSYGPVETGETLWSIAQRYAVSTPMTAQQWLVAFQNANPQALQDPANVNTLRSGVMLDIPDAQTVADITHYGAVVKLREQNMAWSNSGGRLQLLDTAQDRSAGGSVNDSVAALRIARLQEDLLTAKREIAALREQIDLLNTEIDLRDEEISQLKADQVQTNEGSQAAGMLELDYFTDEAGDEEKPAQNQTAIPYEQATDIASGDTAVDAADTTDDASDAKDAEPTTATVASTALAAQMPDSGDTWFQQIEWLPDSLSGLIIAAALFLLLLAALFWALRSMFSRSADDSEYQDMLNELNRRRQHPDETQSSADDMPLVSDLADKPGSVAMDGPSTAATAGSAEADAPVQSPQDTDIDPAKYAADDHADSNVPAQAAEDDTAQEPDAVAGLNPDADAPISSATSSLKTTAGGQAESTFDASAEQVPDAVEGDNDEGMVDDWRDQINTIMDEVDEVEDKEDLPSLAADDSEAPMPRDVDNNEQHTGDSDDSVAADVHDEAQNERMLTDADSDQEQVIAPLSFDIDDNKDGQSTAAGASDQHEDDTADHADDAHEDLPSPAFESDKQENMTSGDAGDEPVQSADDELTTPLAFSTDAAGDDDPAGTDSTSAAVDDSTSDPAADEQQHESAVDADGLMPPLSFDEFSADMDAAAETASSDQDTWTDSSAIEPMQTNFDPFAESMPEPDDNADDWLQDSVEEQTSGTEDEPDEPDEPDTAAAPATQAAASATEQDTSPADVDDSDDDDFDNIEIKLDLARAYLAMGDQQAFRILLDEIGDQGSAAQREEIAALLQQLDN